MGMTPAIDITTEQRRTVLALLNRHLPDTAAWACGSRVKGGSRPASDLDLVVFARSEQSGQVAELREAFEESDLPFRVNLFVWDEAPESFRKHIEAVRVVLIEDQTEAEHIRSGWQKHGVSDLIKSGSLEVGDGYRAKNTELAASGVPFARAGNIKNGFEFDDADYFPEENMNQIKNKGSRVGDVVFTSKGTVGRFAYVRESTPRFVYSPQLCFWRSLNPELLDSRFLFHWVSGQEFFDQIKEVSGQTDMAEYVSLRDQRGMRITLPPIREQRAIAHVLGTLDDKIELNRRMNETLEAMARALFNSWFVDFDPIRAKMEGRDTGLPNPIAELFPDRLVESGLGLIPEDWRIGTLESIASLNPESWTGRNPPEEVVYVDLANTKWGRIEKLEVHSWKTAPSRARRVLRPGDTIVGTVRPGNGSFAFIGSDGLTGSTGFAVLRPKSSNDREIVWCAVTSRSNLGRLAHLADGGAYPAVRPQAVMETPIVLADIPVRDTFASMIAPWLDRIENNERKSRTLAAKRDTLLPKLISGEIRLRNAARQVESVV